MSTTNLIAVVALLAGLGCGSTGSGSTTTGGGGTTASSTSSSSSSSTGGTTGGGGDGGWTCSFAGEGTCTCSNNPVGGSMGGNCDSANANCCVLCNDVGDSYQFCACETIDSSEGMCNTSNICVVQSLTYSNPQIVNSCPP